MRGLVRTGLLAVALADGPPIGILHAAVQDPASAVRVRAQAMVPPTWDVDVRWRDRVLQILVTPPSNREHEFAHRHGFGFEAVRRMCPDQSDPIWQLVGADRDIAIVPYSLAAEPGVSCRAAEPDTSSF